MSTNKRLVHRFIRLGLAVSGVCLLGTGCVSTAQWQDFFFRELASLIATAVTFGIGT